MIRSASVNSCKWDVDHHRDFFCVLPFIIFNIVKDLSEAHNLKMKP